MSRIMIGSFSFDVIESKGTKLLIGWFENTVYKTRWVSMTHIDNNILPNNRVKVA